MAGGVELIDRAHQPNPEPGLDLGGLAHLQEPVEVLEDLHISPPGRGFPASNRQLADNPVDVLSRDLPGRTAQRGQRPLQQTDVILDRHRTEPARPPGRDEGLHALGLKLPRIRAHRPGGHTTTRDQSQPTRHAAHLLRT